MQEDKPDQTAGFGVTFSKVSQGYCENMLCINTVITVKMPSRADKSVAIAASTPTAIVYSC